jgi:hypothetical protein
MAGASSALALAGWHGLLVEARWHLSVPAYGRKGVLRLPVAR